MKNFPIKGIDVSKYEKEIDWLKVKTQIEFVIIRAGYGLETSQKDIKFEENFENEKNEIYQQEFIGMLMLQMNQKLKKKQKLVQK